MAENKEEEEETANWSDLPYDLMELILEKLTKVPSMLSDVSNHARWAAVCVSWRDALDIYELVIYPQLPLLMIPGTDYNAPSLSFNDEAADGFCSFYRTTDKKVLDQSQIRMPRNSHCRGSGHGWLIMVDDDLDKGFPVRLFNPFLSEEILLPSLKDIPVIEHQGNDNEDPNDNDNEDPDDNEDPNDNDNEDPVPDDPDPCDGYTYLHKAILSAEPLSHPDTYIVVIIYGNKLRRLAFFKSGHHAWILIELHARFEDVNYQVRPYPDDSGDLELTIWAVTCEGGLMSFSLDENMARLVGVEGLPSVHTKKLYLVPIGLTKKIWMLVLRTIDIHGIDDENETTNRSIPYSTKEFKIFLLITDRDGKKKWKKIDNFSGRTLFVGDNNSMLIDAADYPGCKPDCIYYTDDYYLGNHVENHPQKNGSPHDMGVYNVKDGSFEKHFISDCSNPMWPVPVWIEPSLSLQKKKKIHKLFFYVS